ncbi:MAG: tail fiber assembly protein [Eubacteriales bacterium]
MKTESNFAPIAPYELEFNGSEVDIVFYGIPDEEMSEDGKRYIYDTYRMTVRNRLSLISDLDNNIDVWLQAAKDAEYNKLASEIRAERNALLSKTDWTQTKDAPLNSSEIAQMTLYRQALRDITDQVSFPHNVVWPVPPEV